MSFGELLDRVNEAEEHPSGLANMNVDFNPDYDEVRDKIDVTIWAEDADMDEGAAQMWLQDVVDDAGGHFASNVVEVEPGIYTRRLAVKDAAEAKSAIQASHDHHAGVDPELGVRIKFEDQGSVTADDARTFNPPMEPATGVETPEWYTRLMQGE